MNYQSHLDFDYDREITLETVNANGSSHTRNLDDVWFIKLAISHSDEFTIFDIDPLHSDICNWFKMTGWHVRETYDENNHRTTFLGLFNSFQVMLTTLRWGPD